MNNATILVVEDDAVSATLLKSQLGILNYTDVRLADDADQAMLALEERPADLVLMDIVLPGDMDGVELSASLRQRFDVAVIYLTSRDDQATFERAKSTDPLGYLTKPVALDELRRVMAMALDRRRLELELRRSEQNYRLIFENAAAGIYTASTHGRLTSVNSALAAMFGFDSSDEMLANVKELAVQFYYEAERWDELTALIKEHKEAQQFESQVMGRDGDVFWVEEHVRLAPAGHGQQPFMLSTVLNVTARKEAQDVLNMTHEILQRTIDAIPDLVCLLDLEGNVILANAPLAQRCGKQKEEILGAPYWKCLYNADAPVPDDPFSQVAASGKAVTNFFCMDPNGFGYLISASPYHGPDGQQIGVVHVARDLSEVKLVNE